MDAIQLHLHPIHFGQHAQEDNLFDDIAKISPPAQRFIVDTFRLFSSISSFVGYEPGVHLFKVLQHGFKTCLDSRQDLSCEFYNLTDEVYSPESNLSLLKIISCCIEPFCLLRATYQLLNRSDGVANFIIGAIGPHIEFASRLKRPLIVAISLDQLSTAINNPRENKLLLSKITIDVLSVAAYMAQNSEAGFVLELVNYGLQIANLANSVN